MTILLDYSSIMHANIAVGLRLNAQSHDGEGSTPNPEYLRYMVLNTIRAIKRSFAHEFGELVIACDGRRYWRKEVFPYYKCRRKSKRGDADWSEIFAMLDQLKVDLAENFPYKLIEVDSAEADDVIGTLVNDCGSELSNGEKLLIVSRDKDFKQLQKYGNVQQYDWVTKKYIYETDAEEILRKHIFCGDADDDVPNVLSDDDTFAVENKRQQSMTEPRLRSLMSGDPDMLRKYARNIDRNRVLIDLACTPLEVSHEVRGAWASQSGKTRARVLDYLMHHRLRDLMNGLSDF